MASDMPSFLPSDFYTPASYRLSLWPTEHPLKMLRNEEGQTEKQTHLVTASGGFLKH